MAETSKRGFFFETSEIVRGLLAKFHQTEMRSVRSYIKVVKNVRLGVMGLVGLMSVVALLTSGILMLVYGLLKQIPIQEQTANIFLIVVGALFTILGVTVLYVLFDQKRWMEKSRANEMLDVVMSRYPVSSTVLKARSVVQNRRETRKPSLVLQPQT